MKPRARILLRVFATNVALGFVPAIIELLFGHWSPAGLAKAALEGSIYANCIGFPGWYLMPLVVHRWKNSSAAVRITAIVGTLLLCATAGCLVANLILIALGLVKMARLWEVFRWNIRVCLLITLAYGILSSVIGSLEERLRTTSTALRERELAEERAQKMAAEARFASLESRVHPHFLFNTLNSISALVREDPAQAERMIERLSALIRFSLDSELAGLVSLSEELRIVRDYLEIEKVRFGARLRYTIETSPESDCWQVPPLSVQTLVENSVKYAVGSRREGASIAVHARVADGALRIEVSDDGPGFHPASSLKPGHGLDLLSRRLAALFGAGASLDMAEREGRMCIQISVAA